MCAQPATHMNGGVDRSVSYLRKLASALGFKPLSFQAGHFFFRPALSLSNIQAARGVRPDLSTDRGGFWHWYKLDYRRAEKSAYYIGFGNDVTIPNSEVTPCEVPICAVQAPMWKLLGIKVVGLQWTGTTIEQTRRMILGRSVDFARFRYCIKSNLG